MNGDLDFTQLDADIETVKADLTAEYNSIKAALDGKFSMNLTGGAYTANTQTIKGVSIDFSMSRLSSLFGFSVWGTMIMLLFGLRAMLVLAGA